MPVSEELFIRGGPVGEEHGDGPPEFLRERLEKLERLAAARPVAARGRRPEEPLGGRVVALERAFAAAASPGAESTHAPSSSRYSRMASPPEDLGRSVQERLRYFEGLLGRYGASPPRPLLGLRRVASAPRISAGGRCGRI